MWGLYFWPLGGFWHSACGRIAGDLLGQHEARFPRSGCLRVQGRWDAVVGAALCQRLQHALGDACGSRLLCEPFTSTSSRRIRSGRIGSVPIFAFVGKPALHFCQGRHARFLKAQAVVHGAQDAE